MVVGRGFDPSEQVIFGLLIVNEPAKYVGQSKLEPGNAHLISTADLLLVSTRLF